MPMCIPWSQGVGLQWILLFGSIKWTSPSIPLIFSLLILPHLCNVGDFGTNFCVHTFVTSINNQRHFVIFQCLYVVLFFSLSVLFCVILFHSLIDGIYSDIHWAFTVCQNTLINFHLSAPLPFWFPSALWLVGTILPARLLSAPSLKVLLLLLSSSLLSAVGLTFSSLC